MDIVQLPSWLASKKRESMPTTIVLHCTAGSSLSGALQALRQRELSYHYLIAKDGRITKCVPYGRIAYHAGVSKGPQGEFVNRYSVGISMVNKNDGFDPYPPQQVAACDELVRLLSHSIDEIKWITTHYAISPGRKTDPKGFPIGLVSNGLKIWTGK